MRLAWAAAALAAAVLAACGGGGGSDGATGTPPSSPAPATGDTALADTTIYASGPDASLPPTVAEAAAVTHHRIELAGTTLAYTATTGHLVAHDPLSGAAEASFFHVSYTADDADPATRPVTFFYNGGPGSASVWLHLGSFGPKRLVTGDPSTTAPRPFPLVDNVQTLLDRSDLVFVDAVGTGYSQAIAPYTNRSFWSVDRDAAVFRDFIVRWLDAHARRGAPVILFGESYGTARTAVLAPLVQLAGVHLAGIVLQSSILNYGSNCAVSASVPCSGYVPSYGAVGAHYRLLSPNPSDLPAFLAQMRSFTRATYDPAAATWLATGTLPDVGVLAQLQATTGQPVARWQARFNLDPATYQATLVPNVLIGRYDARVSAPAGSALAAGGDPSGAFIAGEFTSANARHLRDTLGYTAASPYVMGAGAIDAWDFSHDGHGLPDTLPDLAAALLQNPGLQVLSLNGYHDLATPFHQTERDLQRLPATANVVVRHYAGGHMTYLDDAARAAQKADLDAFYQRAVAP
jgi:carboxypeptidase C (cathepsin A)